MGKKQTQSILEPPPVSWGVLVVVGLDSDVEPVVEEGDVGEAEEEGVVAEGEVDEVEVDAGVLELGEEDTDGLELDPPPLSVVVVVSGGALVVLVEVVVVESVVVLLSCRFTSSSFAAAINAASTNLLARAGFSSCTCATAFCSFKYTPSLNLGST